MTKSELSCILFRIAKDNHTTVQNVRKEIEFAMEVGQSNTDPTVQAKWAAIPRKGPKLTLEEFIDYMVKAIQSPLS